MDQNEAMAQLVSVMNAIESHMNDDALDHADLNSEAEGYAKKRHGCDGANIKRGMRGLDTSGAIDEKDALCFGAWFAYMKDGLQKRGYV